MVADVRFDARLALRYADGEKCADGASSRHSFVQFDTDHVNLDAATAAVVQSIGNRGADFPFLHRILEV